MSKVLVVINETGALDAVLGADDCFFLDWKALNTSKSRGSLAQEALVDAETWPDDWRSEERGIIAALIQICEWEAKPIPAWIEKERNRQLFATLRELEEL